MLIVGVGLGAAMQPLVLAVQNDISLRDMGAGTAASTFFRSLGGAVGVATLGALLRPGCRPARPARSNNPAGSRRCPRRPERPYRICSPRRCTRSSWSPGWSRPSAVVVSLLLPDKVLKGASPAESKLEEADDETAAAEMEAAASSLL